MALQVVKEAGQSDGYIDALTAAREEAEQNKLAYIRLAVSYAEWISKAHSLNRERRTLREKVAGLREYGCAAWGGEYGMALDDVLSLIDSLATAPKEVLPPKESLLGTEEK